MPRWPLAHWPLDMLTRMADACAMVIGNFDGVHCAHRAIIRRACDEAQSRGNLPVKVVTFEPHPATFLRPDRVPLRISDERGKIAQLLEAGGDEVVVLRPDEPLMRLEADQFIEKMVNEHQPAVVVEGSNFRFGTKRRGDVQMLRSLGQRFGFTTVVVDPIEVTLCDQLVVPVSSTLVRWLTSHGRVADTSLCLGRHLAITGSVARGQQRGRTLGVPTANLEMSQLKGRLFPGDGVYGGRATIADGTSRPAAISIGIKPTFEAQARCIEAHLLDFDGDLYGQPLKLQFVRWLRDQSPFPTVDALQRQLERDIAQTRQWSERGLMASEVPPSV